MVAEEEEKENKLSMMRRASSVPVRCWHQLNIELFIFAFLGLAVDIVASVLGYI